MSLSNPKTSSNPAKKFIEWGGKEGVFKYYDKSSETNVILPLPLYIIKLDQLSTVTGYNKTKGNIYANEVHNVGTEELTVRFHNGPIIAKGLWSDIKPNVVMEKGHYTQSVYAALIDPNTSELELVNIKFTRSSLGPWIDAKVGDGGEVIVLDKNPELLTNGDTKFYAPSIVKKERREDILEKAVDMDKELQSYLSGYKDKTEEVATNEVQQEQDDDLPF